MAAILTEFFVDIRGIRIRDLQPCPFGEAYVKFNSVHSREAMIQASPHQFEDVQITLQKHNEGLNWKCLTFNRECWLILIRFPLDFCSLAYIQDAIKSFGILLVWEKDLTNLSRIIIKARVIDLELIPNSIKITEGDDFLSESWTIPCLILAQNLLGAGPPDEDDPPEDGGNPHPPPPQPWDQPPPLPEFGNDNNGGIEQRGVVGIDPQLDGPTTRTTSTECC